MKYIGFEEAANYDYGIHSVLAFPQHWQCGKSYEMPESGRPDSGLMYVCDCEAVMTYGDRKFSAENGQLLYLPQGLCYRAEFPKTPNRGAQRSAVTDYLLNFCAKTADGEALAFSRDIVVITPKDAPGFYEMLREASEKSRNADCPPSLLKAAAYEIITETSMQLLKSQETQKGNYIAAKAVDYIARHCLLREVTVRELSQVCHVSESTLRRMFAAYTGTSPKEYINGVRLRRAGQLLESGGISVAEVSRLCGFDDPSYFSRFYKKHTGKTPTGGGR